VFIACFHRYVLPPASLTAGFIFPVSLVLTALLQFFISYAMAMLAFWLLEISTFIFILFAFEYLASGHMFPLDILPPALRDALYFTPFPYQLYFPISIYLGKSSGAELWRGLAIQSLWVIAAFLFARWMWRRGIRRYSAFGG
jgi:ABC-2 type transport system permease protein